MERNHNAHTANMRWCFVGKYDENFMNNSNKCRRTYVNTIIYIFLIQIELEMSTNLMFLVAVFDIVLLLFIQHNVCIRKKRG